jgi:glutamate--cysteine ligase
MANWLALDPPRTHPVAGADSCEAWTAYALDAPVMVIRRSPSEFVTLDGSMTLRQWIERGHALGYPTDDDIDYHFTTLFPPVRPRGWLELRMIDALPTLYSRAAVAVVTTLLTDKEARAAAVTAAREARVSWLDACALGLQHPDLGRVAETCFAAARRSLLDRGAAEVTLDAVAAYEERFVARRRTPADEALEEFIRGRSLFPDSTRSEAVWT